jgi:Predicted solute binding protein
MKKSLFLLLVLTAMMLVGCSTKDQLVDFIPTTAPDGSDESSSDAEVTKAASPTQEATYLGKTTTKYVKLGEYGDTLNVRPTASKDGKSVGKLSHAQKVDVINIADGWASILFNGTVCYINADYLVDEKPVEITPTPEATPTPTIALTPTPTPTLAPQQTAPATTNTGSPEGPQI